MIEQHTRKATKGFTAAAVFAGLLGLCSIAGIAADKKPAAPAPKAAPAARPAAKPAGGAAGGAAHGATTGGASHGPTANGSGARTTTTTTGTRTTTTTAGGERTTSTTTTRTTTTAGGVHPGAGAGAGAHPMGGAGGASHTSFKSAAPRGSNERVTRSGSAVRTRPNGRVSDVHDARRGMDVHRGLAGGRRVSMERHDGSRLMAERGRRGFVERPYRFHGHDFGRRAYYYHGREYDRFYRGYGYRGVYLNVYAPGVYYGPGFYGWAYNPWAAPIAFGWGWAGNPWFGFYGGYFQPFAVYPSAAFWLTDYIISQDLQAAYEAQAGAIAGGGSVSIPASQAWTDTGTPVVQGQTYAITASGIVSYHDGDPSDVSGPDGRPIDICPPGSNYHNGFPAPQLPCISLIGKINPDGPAFFVGRHKTFVAPVSGELFLGMNDSILGDNSGVWIATIGSVGGGSGGDSQQAGDASGAAPLTPDVKQQIADEVKAQLALENQEASQNAANQDVDPGSSGIARLLVDVQNGHPHVFVAGDSVDVVDASSGQECAISDGDALLLQAAPAADATAANLVVLASKGGLECHKSSTVTVQLTDLQEMQNHMRETIDQGLKDLQAKQGTGGLPQAPPSAQAKPTQTEYASIAPPPDPKDAADIQQADQQGAQAETEVAAEAAQENGAPGAAAALPPAAAPASVGLGQTVDQVQSALGAPARVANLGSKVIYYYSDGMKVVFKDGKVSDVE